MSIEAINWALKFEHANPTHKAILFGLANHANPSGGDCYPSIPRLARYTGLHRSSIIRAIQELERLRVITAVHQRGRRTQYGLDLSLQAVAKRDESLTATGLTGRPDQSHGATTTSRALRPKPSSTIRNHPREERARGTRLPPEWTPPNAWWSWAAENGLAGDEIEAEAEKFKDYWTSISGAKAIKTDWFATWRNWCRRTIEYQRSRPASQRGTSKVRSALMEASLKNVFAGKDFP